MSIRPYSSIMFEIVFLILGVTSPLYSLAAINAIIFGVQGNLLRRMKNPDALSSHFMAGATAGELSHFMAGVAAGELPFTSLSAMQINYLLSWNFVNWIG